MKYSHSLIKTLRQPPADAEVISHQLLVRAGMIRKVAAGIYEFLPLGLKSFKKVENIIRDELNQAGCQEVFLPHLIPSELWQESGRWSMYGPELLRITDRHEREYCFGPTHEEVICDLVRATVNSYKTFPFNLYQIQTKFRDEIRPRFGLMRGREFMMKDGYSFHTSFEDLGREYDHMHQTYLNIFKRCGLECRAVEADTGSIGGSSSHEFMVIADTGEDAIATCDTCTYAANLEKASNFFDDESVVATKNSRVDVLTPNLKSIDEVSAFLKVKPEQMIKTLVCVADDHFVVVCLAGNREVNEIKLKHVLNCQQTRMATDEEVVSLLGVPVGFLGPVGLKEILDARNKKENVRILFDRSIFVIADAVTGANKTDYHTVHVNLPRDLGIQHDQKDVAVDVANVLEGDHCPRCHKGKLVIKRGIEVGHIFKLGTRYSEPMRVNYLDQNGKECPAIMGTYGIGVGRTLAACIEQSHDEAGIIWPRALAPFDLELITLDVDDEILAQANKLYADLKAANLDVLWDDRDDRAGVKFNDADLLGMPLQVILSQRSLAKGGLEFKIRKTGERGAMGVAECVGRVKEILKGL